MNEMQAGCLDNLQVATPCRADWERMEAQGGSGAVRYCQSCKKNVYNVSMMNRAEAEELLRRHEGTLCVRVARRADGTLITGDCPVGAKIKRRRRWGFAALLALLIPTPFSTWLKRASANTLRAVPVMTMLEKTTPGQRVFAWLDAPAPMNNIVMGEMVAIPPPASGK